jgi:hypothetical protein
MLTTKNIIDVRTLGGGLAKARAFLSGMVALPAFGALRTEVPQESQILPRVK